MFPSAIFYTGGVSSLVSAAVIATIVLFLIGSFHPIFFFCLQATYFVLSLPRNTSKGVLAMLVGLLHLFPLAHLPFVNKCLF